MNGEINYLISGMNPKPVVDRTKQMFDIDSDVSDEEEVESPDKNTRRKSQTIEQSLYDQNHQKYISYLNEFSKLAEQAESQIFSDGATYVNHPLIQMTQVNFEKNFGLFDIIDVEAEKNKNNFVKTMTVFTYLENEVNKVIDILQLNLYDSLLMYGEEARGKDEPEVPEIMIARFFPVLRKIFDLIRKLMSYIENLVIQIHSIINRKQPYFKTLFKGMNFDFVVSTLGRALRSIYVIDAIVLNNPIIGEHWQLYKRLLKLAKKEAEKYNTTLLKIKKLEKVMSKLENTILSKRCMEIVMEINFDQTIDAHKIPVNHIRANKDLREYLEIYLERTLDSINRQLGSVNNSADEEKRLLDMFCIFALFKKLYPSEDLKDFWKKAWSFQKKIPIVEGHSFVCVYISTFMRTLCPLGKIPSSIDPKDELVFLEGYITKLDEKIGIDFVDYYRRFCVWLSRMESIITSNASLKDLKETKIRLLQERLSNRIHMICEGVNIVYQINKLIYLTLILHINQSRPITSKLLGSLILGMETLKATAYMIKKKSDAFDTTILSKTVARDMSILLEPIYKALMRECQDSEKKRKEYRERLEALYMLFRILKTPMSELKISIIKYCLNFVDNKSVVKSQQLQQIYTLLNKLEILSYYNILLQKYEKCDYLYYCRDILPAIFRWKRENPNTCKRLQFLFDSFEDSSFLLKKCEHLQNPNQIFEEYRMQLLSSFEENYMLPLKRKVEDFLRLSTHCMLIEKLEGMNPFKEEMSDLIKLVQFEKIRIFDTVVDLKVEISDSFNETFYNMNTINIYDMETYEQMRVMANHVFGLNLHDVYLPNQTVAQGKFDIFTIIRNIPSFIEKYHYNLLSQKFLEVTTPEKMISSVGIQQISDSIRTHGLGILSTTVNAFNRFQIQKIQAFNKFMQHDQLRSLLEKEKKWFRNYIDKEKKANDESFYPYERAKFIYKEIKGMARFEDDSNLIDQLRGIVTSIGNALGFVRLLRSASLNYSSKSVQFLPAKVQIEESMEQISGKAEMSDTTKNACKEFDDILKFFQASFSDKVDYLNLMVKFFGKLGSKENKHFNHFYLIIPVLSINFIEHMTRGKEQVNRKIPAKAFLYDDGLVLGIAYILSILKQKLHYKTLHWDFATMAYIEQAKVYSKDMSMRDNPNRSAKMREDLNMQNQLLLKKLEIMEQEFKFFNYNMISSNVLFKNPENESPNNPASPPTNENEKSVSESA